MRTSIQKSGFARRGLTALAGLAVVAGTLVGVATPASAAAGDGVATAASVNDTQWLVGTTKAVTVSWTNSVDTLTSVLVRSPWPWGASWTADATGFASTGRVASGAQTITCTQNSVAIVFSISSATTTGNPTCKYQNTSNWKGVWIEGGGLSVSSTATISVAFPSGQITAPAVSQTDSWLVGGYYLNYTPSRQAEPTITSYSDATHPDAVTITIDLDPNGGTCATAKVTGYQGTWGKAPEANDCTRSGYDFAGWNTSVDGKGIWILPNGDINFTGDNRVYAQWVSPYQPINPPGLPTDVKATGKWNDVTVNWNAPADAGSLPITNYLVTATPSNKVCITSVVADKKPTQCTLHALVPGTSYTFKVQALNGGGWGSQSLASNAASPFNLKITKYDRKKGNLFQLFKSTVTVSGVTPGYAIGTTITPWIKVGNGEWTKLPNESFKANSSGTFSWSKKFEKKLDSTPISVKFEDPQGNTSNSINTSEVGKLAPSVKINSARLNTSIIKPQITVIGTALNVPDDSRVTITFVQGAKKESVVIRLAKPGDFEARWRAVDPNIPTVVKASVGGVESNPIRVAKRG